MNVLRKMRISRHVERLVRKDKIGLFNMNDKRRKKQQVALAASRDSITIEHPRMAQHDSMTQ